MFSLVLVKIDIIFLHYKLQKTPMLVVRKPFLTTKWYVTAVEETVTMNAKYADI